MTGRLILAGTPIGDLGDATPRLARVLGEADVVAAEDTRRLRRLTTELGITVTGRVTSFFEGNERQRTDELVAVLTEGQTVVVVTDAGMQHLERSSRSPYEGMAQVCDFTIDKIAGFNRRPNAGGYDASQPEKVVYRSWSMVVLPGLPPMPVQRRNYWPPSAVCASASIRAARPRWWSTPPPGKATA